MKIAEFYSAAALDCPRQCCVHSRSLLSCSTSQHFFSYRAWHPCETPGIKWNSEIFTEAHKVNYFNFIGTSLPMHSFIVYFTSLHTLFQVYFHTLFGIARVRGKNITLNTKNILTNWFSLWGLSQGGILDADWCKGLFPRLECQSVFHALYWCGRLWWC